MRDLIVIEGGNFRVMLGLAEINLTEAKNHQSIELCNS